MEKQYVRIGNAICEHIEVGEKFIAYDIIKYLPKNLQTRPRNVSGMLSLDDRFESVGETRIKRSYTTNVTIIWKRVK